CQALVVPSSTEGFCLPLAEALYLGSKVVCSDIPIFREIGNANCSYFDLQSNSIENLSQAIDSCLTQTNLESISADNRFSKEKIAHQFLNLYSVLK
ncbi:MAG: glycosyltransferase, partial [Cyanobacteria bacterium J06635_10]